MDRPQVAGVVRGLPDRPRTEPRARAVRRPVVERRADYRDLGPCFHEAAVVGAVRELLKRRRPEVARQEVVGELLHLVVAADLGLAGKRAFFAHVTSLGGRSTASSRRLEASATSSTAASNTSVFRRDGCLNPLIFRTNWRAASRTSSSLGCSPRSFLMLRHMAPSIPAQRTIRDRRRSASTLPPGWHDGQYVTS